MKIRIFLAALTMLFALQIPVAHSADEQPNMSLLGQNYWLEADDPFQLDLSFSQVQSTDQLHVTVGSRLTSRAALSSSISSPQLPGTDFDFPIDPAKPKSQRFLIPNKSETGKSLFSQYGVFPVRVSIHRNNIEVLGTSFVTHAVYVAGVPSTKLDVALVVRIGAVTGPTLSAAKSAFATLRKHQNVPALTYMYGNSTPQYLGNPQAARALKKSLGTRTISPGPFAPITADSVTRADLAQHLNRTRDAVGKFATFTPNRFWIANSSLDQFEADTLSELGVDDFIIDDKGVPGIARASAPLPITVSTQANSFDALVADSELTEQIQRAGSQALAAERALATASMQYFNQPGNQRRLLTIVTPDGFVTNKAFLKPLLSNVQKSPILQAISSFQPSTEPKRNIVLPNTYSIPTRTPQDQAATLSISDFRSVVRGTGETLDKLRAQRLSTESYLFSAAQKVVRFRSVVSSVNQEFSKIETPPNTKVRATGGSVSFPVTIRSNADYPVTVVVKLTAPQAQFEDGSERIITINNTSKIVRFKITARTSGTFPVNVNVKTPNGRSVLAQSTVTVSAIGATSVGLLLSIGSIVVLCLWWLRYAWKNRRSLKTKPGTQS